MFKALLVVLFAVVCFTSAMVYADEKPGSISGRVMIKEGVPMSNGIVFIFNDLSGPPPSMDRYWRVPDEIVKTDAQGQFVAKLADGKYYIGVVQHKSGDDIGPLQDGDLFLPFQNNGVAREFVIANGGTISLGTITGAVVYKKADFKPQGITGIEGVVSDSDGKPVENALVFAFLTPAMVGKPLFISERTGKDGKYLIRVHEGGTFFLKIRNSYGGGAMKAGEIMGSYGQDKPKAVEVKTGTVVKGINITGIRFSGQGRPQ